MPDHLIKKHLMNKAQQKRFNSLYQKHVSALTRQGKVATTIDLYSPMFFKTVRRISSFFDCPPDPLRQEQFEAYFESLIQTHSWSRVKVDRNGLQLFYKYLLKQEWNWVEIVRPPIAKTLPDLLTLKQVERLLNGTRERRYQTFILVCFSMGLRLGEVLNLNLGDIDSERMKVHRRQAKSKKDRYVTLPKATLVAMRWYWATHRHPHVIFPHGRNPAAQRLATAPMGSG